ncbi:MAG: peptidoglycan recognition protein family protein [Bacteroidetes bacterium]|nr:peptidoglycan recognition protein family protein [Bacteroidota bacterium]
MKKFNLVIVITVSALIVLIICIHFFNFSKYNCSKDFRIITRKEWNANRPIDSSSMYLYGQDLNNVLKYIVIHHSAFSGDFGVKNIQEYQQDNGFNDIAYHFVIGKDGKIYEGRDINLMGAHAGETIEANSLADSIRKHLINKNIVEAYKLDPDYGSIGICLEGNFEEEKLTNCQIQSLKKLVQSLMQKYKIEKRNIILHNEVNQRLILQRGSSSVKTETVCPGKFGIKAVKEMLSSIN